MRRMSKGGEDLILATLVLEDRPMRACEVAERTGLTAQGVSYWLPRMIRRGLLLSDLIEGERYYFPQPVLLCDGLREALEALYTTVLQKHGDMFVFDQADVPADELMKSCMVKSLKLFCFRIKDLKNK